jgi:hypothetical protein
MYILRWCSAREARAFFRVCRAWHTYRTGYPASIRGACLAQVPPTWYPQIRAVHYRTLAGMELLWQLVGVCRLPQIRRLVIPATTQLGLLRLLPNLVSLEVYPACRLPEGLVLEELCLRGGGVTEWPVLADPAGLKKLELIGQDTSPPRLPETWRLESLTVKNGVLGPLAEQLGELTSLRSLTLLEMVVTIPSLPLLRSLDISLCPTEELPALPQLQRLVAPRSKLARLTHKYPLRYLDLRDSPASRITHQYPLREGRWIWRANPTEHVGPSLAETS